MSINLHTCPAIARRGIGLAFVPRSFNVVMRAVAVLATFLTMLLAVKMFWQFDAANHGYQFVGSIPGLGVESLGMACRFGVDGLNVGLVLMGAVVAFAAACCALKSASGRRSFTFCFWS